MLTNVCLHAQAASTTITTSSAATAKLIANLGNTTLLNRLRPQAAGITTIAGRFGGTTATGFDMTVDTATVTVQSIQFALPGTWCTSGSTDVQCGVTFAGTPGAENVLEVGLRQCCLL